MDTKQLERFCPWARVELIDAVERRCVACGLDDAGRAAAPADADVVAGRVLSSDEKRQRAELFSRIEGMGFEDFCAEMAFTWFNRLAAIRYMELHGYLPSRVRMLSCAEDGSFRPNCLKQVTELDLPGLDQTRALELVAAGDDESLFREVLLAQMNELADCLPTVFCRVGAADALTLPDNLLGTGEHSVLFHLVSDLSEEVWESVEALGWMYQFYNAELKAAFFKSKRKATAADIAPATQLFTPEWIVRYMVENSLGRLWMLNNPESSLRDRMDYFIEPDVEHEDFLKVAGPEDITFCDPACGSGHILSYAFELLFAMYEERGYRSSEIPELILEKNLAGMEIDRRAAQIAALVLAMRAREHDRRFFRREVAAKVRVLESVPFGDDELEGCRKGLAEELSHLGEIGSLMRPSEKDLEDLRAERDCCGADLLSADKRERLERAIASCEALMGRFDVVVANPPYMGRSSFNPFMSKWITKNYPDTKSDLCTCFIERGYGLAKDRGYAAMVTMAGWILVDTYKPLRRKVINESSIITLAHLDDMVMRIAFKTCAWVAFTAASDLKGVYFTVKRSTLSPDGNLNNLPPEDNLFRVNGDLFRYLPDYAFAYWTSRAVQNAFATMPTLSSFIDLRVGLQTGDNERFLRLWWEVSNRRISYSTHSTREASCSPCRWFPFNKGGDFRKWYGNNDYVINWYHDGYDIKHFINEEGKLRSRPQNLDRSFEPSITWSNSTAGLISFRYKPVGHLFCTEGNSGFGDSESLVLAQGFGNSSVCQMLAETYMSSHHYKVGDVAKLPTCFPFSYSARSRIKGLVERQRTLSQTDWDAREISWDFKRHVLI